MTDKLVGIIAAVVGLACVAVLLSTKANTTGVIGAATSGLSGLLGTALSPLTGSSATNTIAGSVF